MGLAIKLGNPGRAVPSLRGPPDPGWCYGGPRKLGTALPFRTLSFSSVETEHSKSPGPISSVLVGHGTKKVTGTLRRAVGLLWRRSGGARRARQVVERKGSRGEEEKTSQGLGKGQGHHWTFPQNTEIPPHNLRASAAPRGPARAARCAWRCRVLVLSPSSISCPHFVSQRGSTPSGSKEGIARSRGGAEKKRRRAKGLGRGKATYPPYPLPGREEEKVQHRFYSRREEARRSRKHDSAKGFLRDRSDSATPQASTKIPPRFVSCSRAFVIVQTQSQPAQQAAKRLQINPKWTPMHANRTSGKGEQNELATTGG